MAGAVNENVFQRWFADRDSFDLARKSFYHVGDKAMTVLTLEADLTIEHLRIDFEARANFFGKGFGISGGSRARTSVSITVGALAGGI